MPVRSNGSAALSIFTAIAVMGCGHETTAPEVAIMPVPALTARNSVVGAPFGWSSSSGQPASFTLGVESAATHSGTLAAFISNSGPATDSTFATISQFVRPDAYAGHMVRLSGWLRPTGVALPDSAAAAAGKSKPVSGLWMRVDGIGATLAFDNMQNRPVAGTGGWQFIDIVLYVPQDAIGIAFGILFSGTGQLLADDIALDTVGASIPRTDMLKGPVPTPSITDATGAAYQQDPAAPVNLDFESTLRASASSRRSAPAGAPIASRLGLSHLPRSARVLAERTQ